MERRNLGRTRFSDKEAGIWSEVLTPPSVKPVGHKWIFVITCNEKNEVLRYKARLVAQGFSQHPGIDNEETYSPVNGNYNIPLLS